MWSFLLLLGLFIVLLPVGMFLVGACRGAWDVIDDVAEKVREERREPPRRAD